MEKLLRMNSRFKTTVLRFGGLIGEDRNPYILAGRKTSTTPMLPLISFIKRIVLELSWK
jgi:nucleoside-diphosphate-sugar epimerase